MLLQWSRAVVWCKDRASMNATQAISVSGLYNAMWRNVSYAINAFSIWHIQDTVPPACKQLGATSSAHALTLMGQKQRLGTFAGTTWSSQWWLDRHTTHLGRFPTWWSSFSRLCWCAAPRLASNTQRSRCSRRSLEQCQLVTLNSPVSRISSWTCDNCMGWQAFRRHLGDRVSKRKAGHYNIHVHKKYWVSQCVSLWQCTAAFGSHVDNSAWTSHLCRKLMYK